MKLILLISCLVIPMVQAKDGPVNCMLDLGNLSKPLELQPDNGVLTLKKTGGRHGKCGDRIDPGRHA